MEIVTEHYWPDLEVVFQKQKIGDREILTEISNSENFTLSHSYIHWNGRIVLREKIKTFSCEYRGIQFCLEIGEETKFKAPLGNYYLIETERDGEYVVELWKRRHVIRKISNKSLFYDLLDSKLSVIMFSKY
nr:hypothetical protein K-LCC10_0437 [Kaumoebavirus]